MRTLPENNYYNEVSLRGTVRLTALPGTGLSQAPTVEDPIAGHEIVVIVGSPSKVAKATLIEFVTKLTEHTRVNQGWSGAEWRTHHRRAYGVSRTATARRAEAYRGQPYRLDSLASRRGPERTCIIAPLMLPGSLKDSCARPRKSKFCGY